MDGERLEPPSSVARYRGDTRRTSLFRQVRFKPVDSLQHGQRTFREEHDAGRGGDVLGVSLAEAHRRVKSGGRGARIGREERGVKEETEGRHSGACGDNGERATTKTNDQAEIRGKSANPP